MCHGQTCYWIIKTRGISRVFFKIKLSWDGYKLEKENKKKKDINSYTSASSI